MRHPKPEFLVTLQICGCLSYTIHAAHQIHLAMVECALIGLVHLCIGDVTHTQDRYNLAQANDVAVGME